jgi:hypothetical protein
MSGSQSLLVSESLDVVMNVRCIQAYKSSLNDYLEI